MGNQEGAIKNGQSRMGNQEWVPYVGNFSGLPILDCPFLIAHS
jgi:hypothetical protein